jgi:hypothetical protein
MPRIIDVRKCTDQDYDSFYTPAENFKSSFESYKEKKSLYCFSNYDSLQISGSDKFDSEVLSFGFFPCSAIPIYQPNFPKEKCQAN